MKESLKTRIGRRLTYLIELAPSERIKINVQQALPFWSASLFVGLIAVGYTKLFGYAEGWLQQILLWHQWMIFIVTPLSFLTAWMIVQKFAPSARGSGIPQVMAAIDLAAPKHERKIKNLLSIRIAIIKIFSSVMMV